MTAPALPDDFLNSFPSDALVGVAVSGGGDSMALLHMLLQAGARVTAATVNHHLRDEAGAEAQAVADFCTSHGVPHTELHWHWDGQGNLQDQARRARYRLLADWATQMSADGVALGHTADDNIETFLMGLSRGAGLDGLSGMRPQFVSDEVTFYRPLLATRRHALRDMLQEAKVSWCDDPSNDDPSYHRIQVRQNMQALASLGVSEEQILKSLGNLQATRRDVNADLVRALKGRFRLDHGDLVYDADWLEQLSPESQRRILNTALQFVSGQPYPPRGVKVARVLADLRRKSVLHGCVITCEDGALRVGREFGAVDGANAPSTGVWDGRWQVDGPHSKTTEIRALGEAGLAFCADLWRETGRSHAALMASPSVWDADVLVSAPVAGWGNGWALTLQQDGRGYLEFILSH